MERGCPVVLRPLQTSLNTGRQAEEHRERGGSAENSKREMIEAKIGKSLSCQERVSGLDSQWGNSA